MPGEGGFSMNIMLIDDDETCLSSLAFVIAPLGHDCETFINPIAAVQAYQEKPYDVVITDLKMPGMNGMQVLQAIRAHNPEAKVIICTGYGDAEKAVTARKHGVYAYFEKPLKITGLFAALELIAGERAVR